MRKVTFLLLGVTTLLFAGLLGATAPFGYLHDYEVEVDHRYHY